MKYQLKDICSIIKGATGIMKADGGKYPLVALSDERRSHSEFQFDANAVIVPLISSTGHGHASMKRVHYQEGKFALGNILCAVIPNDEIQLNAKYLHLYLQQFKETLLVPLMKGAANVSLPMNKLADVEIEVPSLERQLEIIGLEDKAAELKNELEEKLFSQDGDVTKLRQALLREAMKGKLTKQNPKDGNAKDLLEKIKAEKIKLAIKEKPLAEIKEEEIPFDIPENWQWCRLGSVTNFISGNNFESTDFKKGEGAKCIKITNAGVGELIATDDVLPHEFLKTFKSFLVFKDDLILALTRPYIADGLKISKCPSSYNNSLLNQRVAVIRPLAEIEREYVYQFLRSNFVLNIYKRKFEGKGQQPNLKKEDVTELLFPLPPLPEQNRIVKKLEDLMKLCDELQASIQASKTENEKLLQGALRDALKKEDKTIPISQLHPEEKHFLKRKVLATYIINQSLNDNRFGDVKFEKILHLSDYFAIKRNLGQAYYQQAAGPYDNAFTLQYFRQIEQSKWFSRKKMGSQYSFVTGQNHSKSSNTYGYFTDEELIRVKKLINYFKNSDYEQPEIISTLYAVWNNRIIRQQPVTDDLLQQDFLKWDIQKVKYKDRLDAALQWMRKEGIIPDGWGKIIEKAKSKK